MTTMDLEARKAGLGGSDIAAVLGLSPWDTPLDVYRDKTGLSEPKEETFAMKRGKLLEGLIAEEWAESTGTPIRRANAMKRHPDYPFMLAHIDRKIEGKDEGLECKSAGYWAKKDDWGEAGTDHVPEYYLTQCHHYLAVTGWDRWHLAVWFGVDESRHYVIERDDEIVARLVELEGAFWRDHVLADIPPDPVNMADVKKLWGRAEEGKTVLLTPDIQRHASSALRLKAEQKKLKAEIEKHELAIFEQMQDAEIVLDPETSTPFATRKNVMASRLDTKRLRAEHPDVAKDYTTITDSRRFSITAAGKKLLTSTETHHG